MSEHTIAENLIRLQNSATAISNAIVEKGGTVASGDGLEEFATDIATIPSGGGGTGKNDVNFYDYDGTIFQSYSADDFLALSAMPDNPTHDGLTSQGWNWSLADAKAYVTAYGKLDIGQMYNTSDGALRLYIHLQEGRLSPTLGICVNGTVTVDWGDNSATETMTGTSVTTLKYLPHTYQNAGDYVICVLPSSGSKIAFGQRNSSSTILCKASNDNSNSRRVYLNALYKVEIPDSVTSISNYVFSNCYTLTSITIPNSVTSIGIYIFSNCYALSTITIPNSVTTINSYCFANCCGLVSISIPSSVSSIYDYAFSNCYALTTITIPNSDTIFGDEYIFSNCYTLTSITIPSGVEEIYSYTFQACYGLGFIKFLKNTPPTLSTSSAFSDIPTDCIIYAPALVVNLYMNGTNYPSKSTYTYAGFATYESGVTLPSKTSDETHTLTWYASINDLKAETNPITVGNGNEVYAKAVAI